MLEKKQLLSSITYVHVKKREADAQFKFQSSASGFGSSSAAAGAASSSFSKASSPYLAPNPSKIIATIYTNVYQFISM